MSAVEAFAPQQRCEYNCTVFSYLLIQQGQTCVQFCYDYYDSVNYATTHCVTSCSLAQGRQCVHQCSSDHSQILNNVCLVPCVRDSTHMCAGTVTIVQKYIRMGLNTTDVLALVGMALVLSLLVLYLAYLKRKQKTYKIKSSRDDYYVNETDKMWRICVVEKRLGVFADEPEGAGNDEYDDIN